MQQPIVTGILSLGTSGSLFHAPFLQAHTGFKLRAVVERNIQKAHLQFPDIKSFTSAKALIDDPTIELVIVNTPNDTHFDYALKAIKAGKHVLVEKPFTITAEEAEILFATAKANNRYVLPYQNRRYDSDFLSVKHVIASERLGRLVEAHFRFDRYRYTIGPKAAKETAVAGSGLLYDLGPHLLDMAISLWGAPLTWTKTLGHFRPQTQVNDYAHIHLTYPDQLQVTITMSMLVADVQPAFVLHGTRGSYIKHRNNLQEEQLQNGVNPLDIQYGVATNDHDGLLTDVDSDGRKHQESISCGKSSYLELFNAIYQTLRHDAPYPIKAEEIIQQLQIIAED